MPSVPSGRPARPPRCGRAGTYRREGLILRHKRSGQPGHCGLRGGAISPDSSGVRTAHFNAMRSRALQSRDAEKESRAFVCLWNSSHLDQSPFAFRRAFSIAMSARTNSHSTGSRALSGIGSILWRAATARAGSYRRDGLVTAPGHFLAALIFLPVPIVE